MIRIKTSVAVAISVVIVLVGGAMTFQLRHGHAQITAPATTGMVAQVPNFAGPPSGFLTCNAASEGLEAYDSSANRKYFCHSSAWSEPLAPTQYLSGTTGTITGTLLAVGGFDSGTVTIAGATAGMGCLANTSDGSEVSTSVTVRCDVTSANTVTVKVIAFVLATPGSKSYSVRVFP